MTNAIIRTTSLQSKCLDSAMQFKYFGPSLMIPPIHIVDSIVKINVDKKSC